VGVALHGAVQAAPAGLAFVAAQTALQTPSAAALVGLTSLIAKFMALTKIQTSVACLIVAAAPVVYEWHKLADANSTQRRLNTELTQLRQGINAGERATNTLERKLRHRERLVADWRQASETPIANRATIPSAAGAASAYVWDEQSGYVRLPKGLALRLRFSEFEMQPRRKASPERVQRPTIDKDGTPSTVLLHALGLTGEEGENVSQTTRNAFREFAALAASHSYVVNEGHSMRENADRYTWVTPALLIEGEQFQENFFNSLVQVMGEERTRIFWQQAQDVFRDVLNEFGQSTKTVSVTSPSENGDVGIIENYYRSDGTVRASRLYDAEWDYLPDALKPYAANLKKPANPQPGEQK